VDERTRTEHKPLIRCTVTLIFPNLGMEAINERVSGLVAYAMACQARDTYVTVTPEDEDDDE